MGLIYNFFVKLFKKKNNNELWLSYYSRKDRKIKFTNKSIYNYMKDNVGKDLDFHCINYFGNRITYHDFFKKIDLVARSLKSLGVKKGDVVSICMPNTPEGLEVFYACNKIGAVADMIHPLSAVNEIKFYLKESNSRILILYDANYDKVKNVLDKTNIYKTILVSVKESMPKVLKIGYTLTKGIKIKKPFNDSDYMTWREFLDLAYSYNKDDILFD